VPEQPLAFHFLMDFHLKNGTRPGLPSNQTAPIAWDELAFSQLVGVSDRTVRNWKHGKRLPSYDDLTEICRILFAKDPELQKLKIEMEAAWSAALQTRGIPGRRAQPKDAPESSSSQAQFDWDITAEKTLRVGLAKLILHRPSRGNSEAILVQTSISFGWLRDRDRVTGLNVEYRLKTAWVIENSEWWQPAENQFSDLTYHKEIRYEGGKWNIYPANETKWLHGNPLSYDTLCTMRRKRNGEDQLTIELQSRPTDLEVIFLYPSEDKPSKKNAIRRRFLQQCHCQERTDVVTWSEVTMDREGKS